MGSMLRGRGNGLLMDYVTILRNGKRPSSYKGHRSTVIE